MICNYYTIFHISHPGNLVIDSFKSVTLQIITNTLQQNPGHTILVYKTAVSYDIISTISLNNIAV